MADSFLLMGPGGGQGGGDAESGTVVHRAGPGRIGHTHEQIYWYAHMCNSATLLSPQFE